MQNSILTIHETHITLPSGKQIALDALNRFTPNQELWELWKSSKLSVKRAGVGITKANDGRWQGYVIPGDGGFSYTPSDLHAYWSATAEQMAETDDCEQVIVKADTLASNVPRPCRKQPGHTDFRVDAQKCKNDTYQLRLHCDLCESKTPSAIAWAKFGAAIVIRAIAYAIQQQKQWKDIEWV